MVESGGVFEGCKVEGSIGVSVETCEAGKLQAEEEAIITQTAIRKDLFIDFMKFILIGAMEFCQWRWLSKY
jgi:hypothetical protein